MKKLFTKTVVVEAVMLAILASSILPTVMAAELNLPTDPLISSTSIEPNMMLLLDSSGSMSNIVPDSPYDEEVDYLPQLSTSQRRFQAIIDKLIYESNLMGMHTFKT